MTGRHCCKSLCLDNVIIIICATKLAITGDFYYKTRGLYNKLVKVNKWSRIEAGPGSVHFHRTLYVSVMWAV